MKANRLKSGGKLLINKEKTSSVDREELQEQLFLYAN